MIHALDSTLDFQSYSADGERAINSISRAALNDTLLDAAESAPDVKIFFEHRLTALDPATGEMTFETPEGVVRASAAAVLGADGAGSVVRAQLRVEQTADYLDYGYKELTIPAVDGDFALDPGALHIWPRGTSMVIALPNPDRSFTCTAFWPHAEFAALEGPAAVERHFRDHYPDLVPLAPDLVDECLHNPVGQLGTVHCAQWTRGRAGLIGDAAHAMVPFYGQGANCGFEDVVELDRCLAEAGSWQAALPLYERRRKANADAIAEMALANFVEMRDKVASPFFQLRKKIEHALERALPGRYVSRYELVSFSTVPYAEVQRRVRRQQRLLGLAVLTVAGLITAAVVRK